MRPEALEKAQKDLVIIGCGAHQPIKAYCGTSVQLIHPNPRETKRNPSETAGYKGKIYGEPTRELHKLFGLTSNLDMTPSGEERKGYVSTRPYLVRVLISIWVSLVVLRVADVKGV